MYLEGIIKHIYETKVIGSNGFRKREMVLVTEEKYPQSVIIEFVQDKTEKLDQFGEGQAVKVSINIKGREWVAPEGETKYFNSIQGWRIEAINDSQTQEELDNMPPPPADAFEPTSDFNEDEHDDLPF